RPSRSPLEKPWTREQELKNVQKHESVLRKERTDFQKNNPGAPLPDHLKDIRGEAIRLHNQDKQFLGQRSGGFGDDEDAGLSPEEVDRKRQARNAPPGVNPEAVKALDDHLNNRMGPPDPERIPKADLDKESSVSRERVKELLPTLKAGMDAIPWQNQLLGN